MGETLQSLVGAFRKESCLLPSPPEGVPSINDVIEPFRKRLLRTHSCTRNYCLFKINCRQCKYEKNILLLINILLFPYLISAQPTSSDLGIDSDIIIFDHYFHAQARDAKYSSTRYAYWGHAGGTKYRTSSQYTALNLNGTLGSIFGEVSSYASVIGRINDYEWSLNTANLMYGVYEYGAGTDWYESGYSTPKARWGNWLGLGGNNQTTRTLVSNMTQNSYETIVDRISYAMGLRASPSPSQNTG